MIRSVFELLHAHYGPRNWWPADTPFEVIVGAILTQNTAWRNVEYAIANLKEAGQLSLPLIASCDQEELEELIRPAGFFRQKAERLQALCRYLLERYEGDLDRFFDRPFEEIRIELLAQKGVGPETADSILLYAGGLPSFVIDAYTHRIFGRVGILSGGESYDTVRDRCMAELPSDTRLFNEYHALIVETAKDFCRKRSPHCPECPLRDVCAAKEML